MLQSTVARIKVPPARFIATCTEDSGSADEETQLMITSTQKTASQKLMQAKGKMAAIEEIMQLNKGKKTTVEEESQLDYAAFAKPIDEAVHQAKVCDRQRVLQRNSEELDMLKDRVNSLEALCAAKDIELSNLRKQNDDLQQQVINKFGDLSAQVTELVNSRVAGQPVVEDVVPPVCTEKNGETHLGYNIWIPTNKMDAIMQASSRPSLFVRGVANAIWGASELKDRSVFGKQCPKYQDKQPRRKLTPRKVNAITASLKHWLNIKGTSDFRIKEELDQVPKYLSQRITDLNRGTKSDAEKLQISQRKKERRQLMVEDQLSSSGTSQSTATTDASTSSSFNLTSSSSRFRLFIRDTDLSQATSSHQHTELTPEKCLARDPLDSDVTP